MRLTLLLLFTSVTLYATTLTQRYPSYAYVMSEFDIDSSYVYNRDFETYVLNHDKRFRKLYTVSLERGEFLMPMVQKQLVEGELTDLLVYLPMIESGFLTDVQSPKKAKGLWQFMPATAKSYNLTVCNSYDERCDPVSATTAAIRHLQKLYQRFGKWYLAIMAYNCGEGRVSQAIKSAGTDELSILIDEEAKYLPKETREYIKRFLLIAMIGESEMIDFGTRDEDVVSGIIKVEIEAGNDLEFVASKLKMSAEKLYSLNSQYPNKKLPVSSEYISLTIPYEKLILFYQHFPPKPSLSISKEYLISHIVSMGETLDSIAKRYQSTIEDIKQVNHLKTDVLILESLLIIPVTQERFESLGSRD